MHHRMDISIYSDSTVVPPVDYFYGISGYTGNIAVPIRSIQDKHSSKLKQPLT